MFRFPPGNDGPGRQTPISAMGPTPDEVCLNPLSRERLHGSAAQHFLEPILQTAKLKALFPTWSCPRGRALAQFPAFVLEDEHRSVRIFNVGANDQKFGAVLKLEPQRCCRDPRSAPGGDLLFCSERAVARRGCDEGFFRPQNLRACRQGSGNQRRYTKKVSPPVLLQLSSHRRHSHQNRMTSKVPRKALY